METEEKKEHSLYEDLKAQCEYVVQELKSHDNDLTEYLDENTLDVSVEASVSRGGLLLTGFSMAVTLGGPNIYIRKDGIHGYWGTNEAYAYVPESITDRIMDYVEEMTEGLRMSSCL